MSLHCGRRAMLVSAVGAADGRPLWRCAACGNLFTDGHYDGPGYEPGGAERMRAIASHHLQAHHRATLARRTEHGQ